MAIVSLFSCELNSMSSFLLQTQLMLLLGLQVCASQETATIILNSCQRCAANSSSRYEVSSETDYSITVSSSMAEAVCNWECQARVYSNNNSSSSNWLCLAQVGLTSQINDSNLELSIYNSHNTDNHIFDLKYYPSMWQHREDCFQTDFIEFYLKKVKSRAKLDFQKLHINFQVLNIESTRRTAYLDSVYCRTEYKLLNSQVSVYNQPPEAQAVTHNPTLTHICGLPFRMLETHDTNKRICLYYIPTDHVDCSSNWTFSVSVVGYSLQSSGIVYSLPCGHNRSRQTHAWCADPGIHQVTVIFQRIRNISKSVEHPHMFRFIIQDYNGTAESLMAEKTNMVRELQKPPPSEAVVDNNKIVVICILVTIAVAVLIIVSAFLYSRRRCLSHLFYGPVHNPGSATAC